MKGYFSHFCRLFQHSLNPFEKASRAPTNKTHLTDGELGPKQHIQNPSIRQSDLNKLSVRGMPLSAFSRLSKTLSAYYRLFKKQPGEHPNFVAEKKPGTSLRNKDCCERRKPNTRKQRSIRQVLKPLENEGTYEIRLKSRLLPFSNRSNDGRSEKNSLKLTSNTYAKSTDSNCSGSQSEKVLQNVRNIIEKVYF